MAEAPGTDLWLSRLTFVLIAFVIIFGRLLPLDANPFLWTGPDLLLAVTIAWAIRRPRAVPVLLIGAIFLLADLLFQRPPGLWAALIVLMTEALRARRASLRNMSLLLEWSSAAIAIIVISLAYRLTLFVMMVPRDPLTLTLTQMLSTILAYPLVVGVAHLLFGLKRTAPGQVDSLGHRL